MSTPIIVGNPNKNTKPFKSNKMKKSITYLLLGSTIAIVGVILLLYTLYLEFMLLSICGIGVIMYALIVQNKEF